MVAFRHAVVYNLRAEIQNFRLEPKNYLNMFDKESHNHIQIFQLKVVPSIKKLKLNKKTIKRITARNNGYKNHFYLKYVEKEALNRTNRDYFPPNVSMCIALSTTTSLSNYFEAHVPINYRFS
jgi:uncharacterized membrane protein YcgQ (UPF0703/DUF1980 family)